MPRSTPDELTGQDMTEGRARDALSRLTGDPDALEYLSRYFTYLHSENARLTMGNAHLRGEARPTAGAQELTVTAGSGQYTRNQPLILMRWTCDLCGKAHERYQLPGNTPRYCPAPEGVKQSDCQREAARRRVSQHRAMKRDMHNSLQTSDDAPPPSTAEPRGRGIAPEAALEPPTTRNVPAWDALNERQRHYLTAIYEVDQSQEEAVKMDAARGNWEQRPASEWRWIRYYSPHGETELQEAIGSQYIDPGTGSTFAALEKRSLIETSGSVDQFNLKVKITKQGRAAVRAALNLKSSSKPAGLLSVWTWYALKLAYEAGEDGIAGERWTAHYGGVSWDTWLRLRNRKNGEMVEEFPGGGGIRITHAGRTLYLQRLDLHRQHYPHLYEDTQR